MTSADTSVLIRAVLSVIHCWIKYSNHITVTILFFGLFISCALAPQTADFNFFANVICKFNSIKLKLNSIKLNGIDQKKRNELKEVMCGKVNKIAIFHSQCFCANGSYIFLKCSLPCGHIQLSRAHAYLMWPCERGGERLQQRARVLRTAKCQSSV